MGGGSEMYKAKSAENQVAWRGGGDIKVAQNDMKHILVLEFFEI